MDESVDQKTEPEVPETLPERKSVSSRNWSTLIAGAAMLLIGLVLGYIGRGALGPEAMATRGTATAAASAVQTRAASNQAVMDLLIGETRHFKGDPNARVTLIEFSDFQ
jgi:hypothetical protein